MLKTPAALLGLFGGDEMYVIKPQQYGGYISVEGSSSYTINSDSLVKISPIKSSSSKVYVCLTYPNGEKVSFALKNAVGSPWPESFVVPAGTKLSVEKPPIFFRLDLNIYPLVPAKSVRGGVKTLIRRIANATFKGGLRDATREENVTRGCRQHVNGSLRSASLVSNRIRSVHHRRRANYHTYKPYHSQCADIRNVHSELPEVHVGDTRQNQRVLSLIRQLFRCGTGEKYLGGNGPSGSGVRGFAVASGMNLRGLRLKEAA